MAAVLVILRLMVAYPEYLGGGKAGKSRVGSNFDKPFGTDFGGDFCAFGGCPLVTPDNGRPYDFVGFVQHNQTMHLPGKADTFYVCGIYAAFGNDLTDGAGGSFFPVLGILLSPAVLRLVQGVVSRGFGNRTAFLIIEYGLGCRGSYVYTYQVVHGMFLLK